MAPFPEDEIMTIKRLEVALRKSDFKLLKEGAYKLHEKYHSHHRFEYPDLLEEILNEVQSNYAIPPDVKDILIPTIQDILSNGGKYEDEPQNRVSSLTSLSYGINNKQEEEVQEQEEQTQEQEDEPQTFNFEEVEQQPKAQEDYIKPFQEFTPIQPIEMIKSTPEEEYNFNQPLEDNEDSKLIVDSYNEAQTEDFDTGNPVFQQQNIFEDKKEEEPKEYLSFEIPKEDNVEETQDGQYFEEEKIEFLQSEEPKPYEESAEQYFGESVKIEEQEVSAKKSVAIFFGQDSSNEKVKNIEKYRNLIHNHSDFSINEITSLINEIKTQADTNVSELQTFLEQLKTTNHNINLITNSQSSNLIDLFNQINTTYSIFNPTEEKRVNLLPIFGLTNLFKCLECDNEYLETNEKINSFIMQCPKCKEAMLPDLYSPKGEINMDYYNSAIITLANSDTWLLVHPSLTEKLTLNMIRSAMKVSSKVKEVYVLDKDINIRETYRKLFEDINPEIKVSSDINAIEEFFRNFK